jgi:DMSO/TMAO reductase YedYZ molybdopterin-dependent catalytic subunit
MKQDRQHNLDIRRMSRRQMLAVGSAVGVAASTGSLWGDSTAESTALMAAKEKLQYLTPVEAFREFNREKPRMDQLSAEKLREVGLDRDTWRLEVVPDPQSNCEVGNPLSIEQGTALDWPQLMKLSKTHAVRFLTVLSCTNISQPLGMGLWEGVPLKDVLWLTRPKGNIRRVYYYGYHNEDADQRFISSVSVGRVLEEPPGELPIILCYKLNNQWLPVRNGGPVRLIFPGAYGNKSVKWLQRIVLTNDYKANDRYAEWNNDVESWMKTHARFINPPQTAKAGQAVPLVGFAQVGISGLQKVQYSIEPEGTAGSDDPFFMQANWRDAEILPPPKDWGGGLDGGQLPQVPLQFDPATGQPHCWPLRYTIAHWAAMAPGNQPGKYQLRCRTIDARGVAQPMPRPFPKSGSNVIHQVPLTVEA